MLLHIITTAYITLMITVPLSAQKAGHLAELMCMIWRASTFTACFVAFLPPSTNGHLVHSIAGVCVSAKHHLYFAGGSEIMCWAGKCGSIYIEFLQKTRFRMRDLLEAGWKKSARNWEYMLQPKPKLIVDLQSGRSAYVSGFSHTD